MENSSENALPQDQQEESSAPDSINPFLLGGALAAVFAVGLFLGLLGRPLVIQDVPVQVVVTVVANSADQAQAAARGGDAGDSNDSAAPATEDESESNAAAATPTLMEFVMSDARHIQGDPEAPITIVEFSDFK